MKTCALNIHPGNPPITTNLFRAWFMGLAAVTVAVLSSCAGGTANLQRLPPKVYTEFAAGADARTGARVEIVGMDVIGVNGRRASPELRSDSQTSGSHSRILILPAGNHAIVTSGYDPKGGIGPVSVFRPYFLRGYSVSCRPGSRQKIVPSMVSVPEFDSTEPFSASPKGRELESFILAIHRYAPPR